MEYLEAIRDGQRIPLRVIPIQGPQRIAAQFADTMRRLLNFGVRLPQERPSQIPLEAPISSQQQETDIRDRNPQPERDSRLAIPNTMSSGTATATGLKSGALVPVGDDSSSLSSAALQATSDEGEAAAPGSATVSSTAKATPAHTPVGSLLSKYRSEQEARCPELIPQPTLLAPTLKEDLLLVS